MTNHIETFDYSIGIPAAIILWAAVIILAIHDRRKARR